MLLKFILITFLIVFLIVRFFGFIFRAVFWMLGMRAGQRQAYQSRPAEPYRAAARREGDVTVDYVPKEELKKRQAGFNGGEYVDYEEVK